MDPMHNDLPPLVRQSLQASAAGDDVAALQLLRDAVADAPQSALCHFMLGAELAQAGAIAEAESAMATAVLLAPQFPIARFQLGLLQFTSGRAAPALLTWQPLLELGEHDALFHFVQAFAALAGDQFDEARAAFARGIALNKSNEPLNHDMRQVVQRIESLQRDAQGTEPSPVDDAPADDGAAAHVLLSNYGGSQRH